MYVAIGTKTHKIYELAEHRSLILRKLSSEYPSIIYNNVYECMKGKQKTNLYPEPITIKKVIK